MPENTLFAPLPEDYVRRAGVADATVRARTGRGWADWVRVLDAAGADAMSHTTLARHIRNEHGLSPWWARAVTVAYERIRGLPGVGQGRRMAYEVNKTRTLYRPVSVVYRAVVDGPTRSRWLPVELEIRATRENRNVRTLWPDGSQVDFQLVDKGGAKCALVVHHRQLESDMEREDRKAFWAARLERLAMLLTAGS